MTIREFQDGDETAFYELNEAWILQYFVMEKKDADALRDPHGTILAGGGKIYFAIQDGAPVGCCALVNMGSGEYEVAKMAVSESMRGTGIGRRLLTAVIEEARRLGAHRLHLETNRSLTPAIHLYEALGFQHLPPERFVPSDYARSNVQMELALARHA
jgi:putative acetyltransferase